MGKSPKCVKKTKEDENTPVADPNHSIFATGNLIISYYLPIFNPLTQGPQANQPYKCKMPNVQKVPKWDKSHTTSIPLLVHFRQFTIIGIPKYGLI